jgi:hypothetical protein
MSFVREELPKQGQEKPMLGMGSHLTSGGEEGEGGREAVSNGRRFYVCLAA